MLGGLGSSSQVGVVQVDVPVAQVLLVQRVLGALSLLLILKEHQGVPGRSTLVHVNDDVSVFGEAEISEEISNFAHRGRKGQPTHLQSHILVPLVHVVGQTHRGAATATVPATTSATALKGPSATATITEATTVLVAAATATTTISVAVTTVALVVVVVVVSTTSAIATTAASIIEAAVAASATPIVEAASAAATRTKLLRLVPLEVIVLLGRHLDQLHPPRANMLHVLVLEGLVAQTVPFEHHAGFAGQPTIFHHANLHRALNHALVLEEFVDVFLGDAEGESFHFHGSETAFVCLSLAAHI